MVKLNSPLISLAAQGSIGDSLTFKRRGQTNIAGSKPTPANPQTLPQYYSRFLYCHYALWWKELSEAEHQVYSAYGSPFHLTGYQFFMKECLSELPDILLWARLDTLVGGQTPDSGKLGNTGTVVGCSQASGLVGTAFSFDGINDYVDFGNPSSLYFDPTKDYTFVVWSKRHELLRSEDLLAKRDLQAGFLWCFEVANARQHFLKPWVFSIDGTIIIDPLVWHCLAVLWSNQTCQLFVNAMPDSALAAGLNFLPNTTTPLWLGRATGFGWWHGENDNLLIFNRKLSVASLFNIVKYTHPGRYP
jgi:hypothetical protein